MHKMRSCYWKIAKIAKRWLPALQPQAPGGSAPKPNPPLRMATPLGGDWRVISWGRLNSWRHWEGIEGLIREGVREGAVWLRHWTAPSRTGGRRIKAERTFCRQEEEDQFFVILCGHLIMDGPLFTSLVAVQQIVQYIRASAEKFLGRKGK